MASNSIKTYLERLGKSISYAAFDVLKEQIPITTNFVQSNAQTVRDTIKNVVESKNNVNKIADALNINYAINAAKKTIRNAKEDIKSGQFQNPERAQAEEMNAMMEMMSKMMGEDVSSMVNGEFQAEEGSDEEYPIKGIPTITKGDTVVASVVAGETRRAANSITDTLTAIANNNSRNQSSIASVQISQNERQTLILNAGLSSITQGLNSVIEFNNKILKVQAENTRSFQEKMVNLTTENNAIFKELIEIQRALYKPKQKEEEQNTPEKSLFVNGFNLKNYMDYVKGNVERNPFYQMASMMIQSFPMMIQDVVNNPMQFLSKKVIEGLMGPALKTAMRSFDTTIGNAFRTGLARLYDYGNDPRNKDSIFGQLARIFGFKQRDVKFASIDTSKYNKGAMSWNGIAQKALVEVIPAHLRRIEGQITGKGERYFNYQSGKWMSATKAARAEKEIDIKNARKATTDIRQQMETALAPFRDQMSKEDTRDLNRAMLQMMQGIYNRGSVDYRDIFNHPEKYGNDERLLQLLLRALNTVDRDTIMRATGKIASVKRSKEQMVNGMDMSNQGIHNDIASGAFAGTIGAYNSNANSIGVNNLVTTPAMNLTTLKDSRGMTLYDYQLMIYRELFAIRRQGIGLGGGSGSSGSNNPVNPYDGFVIQDNQLPTITNREQPERDTNNLRDEIIKEAQDRARERTRTLNAIRVSSNGLDMEESLDLERFRTDDDYANSVLERMNRNRNTILSNREREKIDANRGFVGNALNLISGGNNNVNEGYPEGVDPDAPFIEQMTQAATLGQKMGVISRNLRNIASAPTTILTSVFTTADKFIFDMLFEKDTNMKDENNQPVKGVFGGMIKEMKDVFSSFNDWLNDIFKDLSKGDGFAKKIKSFLKNVFNFDIDEKVANLTGKAKKFTAPVGEALKLGIKNNFREIREAFAGTASDLGFRRNQQNQEGEEQSPTPDENPDLADTEPTQGEQSPEPTQHASGARNVKRGGLAFISEGEAIIPADLNPWNPDRDKVDRNEQSKNESRMKQRFMSKLDSSLGKYIKQIPQHASGISAYVNNIPKDMIAKILGNISNDPEKAAKALKKRFGIELDPKEITKYKTEKLETSTTVIDEDLATQILKSTLLGDEEPDREVTSDKNQNKVVSEEDKTVRYNRGKGVYNGINQFLLSAFGTDSKMAAGDIAEFTIKHSPELAGGGIGGALIGTILPLGGPLFGAIAGACAALLGRNKSAMEYLFGSEMTDPKTGKVITKEGVIPRKIANTMQKYMPDLKKYGIVGTLTGLITPFGPLGGLMIGAGASIVKNNEDLKRILFGDETGLINKERKQYIKKALPNIGAGVLATLFMGPFGILGNAVLGSGLGLLSTTEQFKRIMLGTKDRNGIRRGGIAGAIRRQITEPFKRTMNEIRDNLGSWFRDKILGPIGRGLTPIGKVATSVITWGINGVVKHFRESIGGRFIENLFDFALGRIRNAGGLGKYLAKKVGGIASFGSRMVEKLGDKTKAWGIKHGFGENFTAAERLETYGRTGQSHSDRAAFDRALVNMNPKELQQNAQMLETIYAIENGKIDALSEDRVRSEAVSLTGDLKDKIGQSKDRKITENDVRKIEDKLREIHSDKDLEKIVSSIDTDHRYDYVDEKDKEEIKKFILSNGKRILQYRRQVEALKDSRTLKKAKKNVLSNMGLSGFSDDVIHKNMGDYVKYANRELERVDNSLKSKLGVEKEAGNVPEDATVENLIQLNDFQKAQLSEQQEMNKNLKTLIDVVLGRRGSVTGEVTDIDTLRDQNDIDKINRHLDNQEDYIKRTVSANRDKINSEVSTVRQDIFGDKLGRGNDALQGLSDEKLITLLGSNKKKRNEATTYLRAIAGNYDSTLSRLMNTDKFLELSSKGMKRITELTLRGYEINENDYKDIESLSDYGYKAIIELAKMGVKIDSYKAIDRYFDKYGNDSEKKKSLEALLNFAGVRLKDGKRIVDTLTTSEIAENLEDDEVRGLRYNNAQNSYQIGINKAIQSGNVPNNLKLQSTAKADTITSKKKSTDFEYDADKVVSNTNLDATIQKTASMVDNAVDKIYRMNESVLKTVLQTAGSMAAKGARAAVPGADIAMDRYAAHKAQQYDDRRSSDQRYAEDERRNETLSNSMETYLNHQSGTSQTMENIQKGFESRRKPGRNNSITEVRTQTRQNEENKQKQQEQAKQGTDVTQTVTRGNNNTDNPVASTKVVVNGQEIDVQGFFDRLMNGSSGSNDVGTHAGGLLSAFKDYTLNSVAENISKGSTERFAQRKEGENPTRPAEQLEQSTQKATTEPVNKLEEDNNLREGNSITQAGAEGFNLINNPIAPSSNAGGQGQNNNTQNVPTGDGDIIEYEKDRYGNLSEKHTKGNVQIRQKQQYKLSLQERSTRALELLAKGGNYVKDKAISGAKKVGGGLLDGLKGLISLPIQLISGIIGMIPFLGPALGLGAKGLKFLGKFLGNKLLDKIVDANGKGVLGKIGTTASKGISWLQKTRVGSALAERLGLDKLKNRLDGVQEEEEEKEPHPIFKAMSNKLSSIDDKMSKFLAYITGQPVEDTESSNGPSDSYDDEDSDSGDDTIIPPNTDDTSSDDKDKKDKDKDKEESKGKDSEKDTKEESGSKDNKDADKGKEENKDKGKESGETKPSESGKDDNKSKNDNKNKDKSKGGKKKGLFANTRRRLSNAKTSIKNKTKSLKDRLKNKTTGSKPFTVGKSLLTAAKRNKRLAALAAIGGTIGALELSNYGTFTGEGLINNAEYATGLKEHKFDASKYWLNLTPSEQMEADALVEQGKNPEIIAKMLQDRHNGPGKGSNDKDNLYDKGEDLVTTPFSWAWNKGKDAANFLIDNPIANPITELAVGHVVSRLSGSPVKGAFANTVLEGINKYRTGEYDDSGLLGILGETGGDFLTNLMLNQGLDSLQNHVLGKMDDEEQEQDDRRRENESPSIDANEANRNKPNRDIREPKNPMDEIKDQNLSAEELSQWYKDNKERIDKYNEEKRQYDQEIARREREEQNSSRPREQEQPTRRRNLRERVRNRYNSTRTTVSNAASKGKNKLKNMASSAKSGIKTAGSVVGNKLKNVLKSKKGRLGAAALIATPILTGMFDESTAEASILNKAHAFETKGSIKSNIDEQGLLEDAEAAAGVDNTQEQEPTEETNQESSNGFLDIIRNNPVLSSAITFAGAIKGGEWGGKLGEKLFGSKGKMVGSLLGGTVGGNILDPSNITPEGIIETFLMNKAYDKGTEALGNVLGGNKDDQQSSSNSDALDELNDQLQDEVENKLEDVENRNKDNKPEVVNNNKKSLSERLKGKVSGVKSKIQDIASGTKDKIKNISSTVQNTNMKNATTNIINATRKGVDEGSLKVQALVGQLKERIKSLTSTLSRWIKGKGALEAIKNFSAKLIENITKPQNVKKIIGKLARSSLKSLALGAGPYVAAAVVGVGAISDFIHGYNSADELYDLKPGLSTTGMKIVAGFVTALVGVIPYVSILIPEDFVLQLAVEYIGPAFGFGKRELEELRKSGEQKEKSDQNEVSQNTTFGEDFQSMVKGATQGIISKVVSTADDAATAAADMGKTIANKVGEAATVARNWVADTSKTVGDWISDKASRGWEYLKDKANDAANTVGEIYNSASSTVKEKYESVKNTIKEHLPSFGSGKHSLYGMSKFYSQLDPRYAMKYNAKGDTIPQSMSDSGCGPAALSNAMSSMGINVDPRLTAEYALSNGYKEQDGGTKPEFFSDVMNKLGTGSSRLHNQSEIMSNLKEGKPVILMGKDGRGETKQTPYAENPHYVTATGIDRKGNIIVQDPESFTPNKRYKPSDVLNKSTIAITSSKGKYGRARNIFYPRILKSNKPKFFGIKGGLGRRYRYGTGNNNVPQMIWDFLTQKGLGSTTVAAIIGNIGVESAGFQLDALSSDGHNSYGLCQWTAGRKEALFNMANQMGKDPSDIDVQLNYLWTELTGSHKHALDATVNCGDNLEQAVEVFCRKFEVPDMRYAHLDRRNEYARQAFQTQGRGVATSGTYTPGGSGSSSGSSSSGSKNGGLFGAISNVASILSSALNPFGTASASPTTLPTTSTTDNTTFSNTQSMVNYGTENGKSAYATKDKDGNTVIKTESIDNALGVNSNVSNDQIASDVLTNNGAIKPDLKVQTDTTKTGSGKHRSFKSRFGRLKHVMFGTGEDITVTETTPSTENVNMTAQEAKDANNEAINNKEDAKKETTNSTTTTATTSTSTSSGGLFGGLEAFAKQIASPLGNAMKGFGSALTSGISAVFGDKLKFLFGDNNPFLEIFGGGQSSSNGNKSGTQTGPGQSMNIKVAGNPVDTLVGSMPGAVVTSDYGAVEGRPTAGAHGGVDIGADKGTPIPSPVAGTVVDLGSGWGGGYGNYIQIQDSKGNYHMFAHCDTQNVSVGQQVQPGTVLGTVGETGQSYGAHLHYEIDPPENQGAVKGGPTLNPNSYTGAGKHLTSMGMGKLILPKYGMGLDPLLDKSSNDTFDGLDSVKLEAEPNEELETTSKLQTTKPRDEEFTYDGFGVDKVPKYGTGWFSDFTKRSINTIKDTFDRWFGSNNKDKKTEDTTTTTNSNVPSREAVSVGKDSNSDSTVPQNTTTTQTTTEQTTEQQASTPAVTTNTDIKKVTDSQKLDAILDAMNENNRLMKQQNQLLGSLINIASNYINSNVVTIDQTKQQQTTMNTNTRGNNYDYTTTSIKAQLSQMANGSQFGLGDRFGTRDADGFSEIIKTINEVASR